MKWILVLATCVVLSPLRAQDAPAGLFRQGDRVLLLGGAFVERMQHSGWLETEFQRALPGHGLVFRNLGWSGDEVGLRPRPLAFESLETTFQREKPDVLMLCFGSNEAFAGPGGLDKFRADYRAFLDTIAAMDLDPRPRLILVGPTAHEHLGAPFPDADKRNRVLRDYASVVAGIAKERDAGFADLLLPVAARMEKAKAPLTINGIHFTDEGYRVVARILLRQLGVEGASTAEDAEPLRKLVVEKNHHFFRRWRPINGEYVFGRRKDPYGVLTFPPEMKKLDAMVMELDRRIHAAAGLGN